MKPVWGLLFLLLSALVACGEAAPTPQPTPTPTATAAPSPAATASPLAEPTSSPTQRHTPGETQGSIGELGEVLDGIGDRVSSLRGLTLERTVDRRFMTREELASFLQEKFEKENTREELLKAQELLTLLGLLKGGVALPDLMLSLLNEQVIGLFDPDTETLYVLREERAFGPVEETTFAHEIVHALQQQHFDINALDETVEEDAEASAALTALIEGDATLAQAGYAVTFLDPSQLEAVLEPPDSPVLDTAPQAVQQLFLFPYAEGTQFVASLFQSGGWEAVNEAYQNPPTSTEHILHPRRYLRRDVPVTVALPDLPLALGPDWSRVDGDVMGEFLLRIYLESQTDAGTAAIAAEGWGGDRYALLAGPEDQRLLALMTRWDTPQDAQEFFEAYVAFSDARGGGQWRLLAREQGQRWWRAPGQSIYLSRAGDSVLLLLAPQDAVVQRLLPQFPGF